MGVLDVFNWQGLNVSTFDTIFTVEPEWFRLDDYSSFDGPKCHEIQIRRGRSDEFERTDTGTCRAFFHERSNQVDPTVRDWISRPFSFAVRNPVTDTWHPRFRGGVTNHSFSLSPGRVKGDVVIEAADALAYFSQFELAPGLAGDTPPPQTEGYVFYEDTAVTGPQIRINQALADAGWPSGLSSIFTGNVNLLETVYSPGESILTVIHDAADAEFPGVANFFVDKYGVVCFHGRLARFDPDSVSATATHWDFHTWDLGSGGAQIGPPFVSSRDVAMIRNAAMCYPQGIPTSHRLNQVVTDSASITVHGTCSWAAENLITKEGITSALTGEEECFTFANYIVYNYAESQVRVPQVTLRPVRPTDPRAEAIWEILCQVDISDRVTVEMDHPGGGGVTASFFVEGITETWRPLEKDLDTGFPFCEMTLDLSPDTYWNQEPF